MAIVYPLQQVVEVKQKRVEDAELQLKQKLMALEVEKQKLAEKEAARDKVKEHLSNKMVQLRRILDEGTTCPKIEQVKIYVKVVKEQLAVEEKKVKEQQNQVTIAQNNADAARQELNRRRQEVDKMYMHREDWQKQMRKELEVIEAREQDELGSIGHFLHKRMGF